MSASWIIRNKETKTVVCETFTKKIVDRINTAKYEAIPIKDYLARTSVYSEAKPGE